MNEEDVREDDEENEDEVEISNLSRQVETITIPKTPKVEVGTIFANRKFLHDAGIHSPLMAGIDGNGSRGASSIVMSGGYEDDIDEGERILYTGQGGMANGKFVADQVLERGNAGLVKSMKEKWPVRVTRGHQLKSSYAPLEGYRYDGYYLVTKYWREMTNTGFKIWRFELKRLKKQEPLPPSISN